MSIDAAQAAQAYLKTAKPGGAGVAAQDEAAGPSFADMVQDAVGGVGETLQNGEDKAMAAATGGADLTEIVTAVSAAEITLETVVAIRDRVISAYQEIMRMPI